MSSNNKGSALSRMFGGSSKGGQRKTAQTPQEAIQQLRDVEDVLNKKVEHLEGKINEETAIARRDARTNKRNALNALKRKKRLEKTLQQIDGTLTTLEYQREALQVNISLLIFFF
jgi:charged multivesicular body protein 4